MRLDKNQLIKENPRLRKELLKLIEEYLDVSSSPDEMYGCTNLMEFCIELKEGAKPSKKPLSAFEPPAKGIIKEAASIVEEEQGN